MGQIRVNPKSWRQRFFHFSLRTLVLITALVCVAAGIYKWRERREQQLFGLVIQFNAAIDEGKYQQAVQIAENASLHFPGHPVTEHMLEKGRLVLALSRGEPVPDFGFQCY